MRLAIASPLPPLETGVADYVMEMLPHLAKLCELRLLVQEPAQVSPEIADKYEISPLADVAHLRKSGAADLVAYEVGNSGFHAHQLRHVEATPGMLVLHDPCLHPLLAYLTIDRGDREGYRQLFVDQYGEVAKDWPERMRRGRWQGYDMHRVFYRLPLSGSLVKRSVGVMTLSEHAAKIARRWAVGPVRVVPHGAAIPNVDREQARRALGIAKGRYAVGMLGGTGPNRMPEVAVAAFARLREQAKDAQLVIAGHPGPEIDPLLAKHGIGGDVIFLGRPSWSRYLEAFAALDVGIALRFPTCGETSGTGIRLMSVGVPFVTDDVDAFRELPDSCCVKVPVQSRVDVAVADALLRWHRDPAARAAAGSAGLAAIRKDHRLEDAAAGMVAFAEELLPRTKTFSVPQREKTWPRVEAVMISYNGAKFIAPSLQSLLDQDYPNLGITVVDNASSDGTADLIRRDFPAIKVVASQKNLGFASGNNLVFHSSDAAWFALLNQDAVARRDWITEMVRAGETDPRISAVGAKMLMQRCPTILNSAGIQMNEAGFGVDRWIGQKDEDQSPIPQDVFGVCGGAMMLRGKDLRELGGFDDSFFMYFEDVDLCWRMRIAGRRIVYAPLAVVFHDWHGDRGSGNRAMRRRFMCERNRLWSVVKNWESQNLKRTWAQMKEYERMRLGWVKDAIARGDNVEYFEMVGKAIRKAWSSTRWRMPWLLWKRRKVQALRKVPDAEVMPFITPGVGEPSFVGDLEVVRDRFSAKPVPRIKMGTNDKDSLGPGWHPLEGELRWSKGKAWFYLVAEQEARVVQVEVAGQPVPAEVRIFVDDVEIGMRKAEGGDRKVLEFPLPAPLPKGRAIEGKLLTTTFRPVDLGGSQDVRELGLYVFGIGLA